MALRRDQHVPGGPPGRAAVASDGQAGRAGCGCDEGLQPSRRHRARPLRWVRNDPPGSGACRAPSLHTRDRAPLRRRRDQALASLFWKGCHLRGEWPELRRHRKHTRHRVRCGRCAGALWEELMVKQSKTTNGAQPSDAAPKYGIGYGRPPEHTRFKPGHPGCGGRPKRQRNLRTVLEETLDERITIREGNRTRSVSKRDAIILRLVNDAVHNELVRGSSPSSPTTHSDTNRRFPVSDE